MVTVNSIVLVLNKLMQNHSDGDSVLLTSLNAELLWW